MANKSKLGMNIRFCFHLRRVFDLLQYWRILKKNAGAVFFKKAGDDGLEP